MVFNIRRFNFHSFINVNSFARRFSAPFGKQSSTGLLISGARIAVKQSTPPGGNNAVSLLLNNGGFFSWAVNYNS